MITTKQKIVAREVGKGMPVSKAMKIAGYSPSTCRNTTKVTKTEGFQKLLNKYLPESKLLDHHDKLLNQKQLNYFSFSKDMPDEEIIAHLNSNGIDVVNIRYTDKGKLAFYSIDDANAKKSALDMAYKLKGSYAAEKHEITVPKPILDLPDDNVKQNVQEN